MVGGCGAGGGSLTDTNLRVFMCKGEGKGRKRAATVAAVGEERGVAALQRVKGIMDGVGQLSVQPLLL